MRLRKTIVVSGAVFTLLVCELSAQTDAQTPPWAPDFRDRSEVFEVSASTYAWEVHDEGVEDVLDRMQRMAGVNSVYLIALMHYEPRPYRGERFPHNPVRRTWMAEDSCAYWHPDLSMYGRIKPDRSTNAWLRDTDYLRTVVDACRKRGIKVGVEVSHTVISTARLKSPELADVIQRDITGKPARVFRGRYVPCLNNPDFQEYIVALFGDLAKNYDVDYIQTCMVHFADGDPSEGGCFCDWCIKAAEKTGYDMEVLKAALRKNPTKQPQRRLWEEFRRKSVTALYKRVIEAVHKQNPKIDFRLNHWTRGAKRGGLYVEDVVPMLNSIRLMSYHEQEGDPKKLDAKRDWIADTMKLTDGRISVLAAMGVRDKAYPELIHAGVKVAVSERVQGITLGHYDGAAFSILRAIRNGMVEAGVPGIEPIGGSEVEEMTLDGYESEYWAYERCVKTKGTGKASRRLDLASGSYNLRVGYADLKKGDARLTLFIDGRQVDSWVLDKDFECWAVRTIPHVRLTKGDEIKIVGEADGEDGALVDFVEFARLSD
ncbi:MAG: glycoside hydrolase family 10 protein [Planctomycetota bacterium]|jgi:hypothetical protein